MKLEFTSPCAITDDDYRFNEKWLKDIEAQPGSYAVGVVMKIEGKNKIFPLYVGTAVRLGSRIRGHRSKENLDPIKGALNSFKEIFNLKMLEKDYKTFYEAVGFWDDKWISKSKKPKDQELEKLFKKINKNFPMHLIWLNNERFFQLLLNNNDIKLNGFNLNRHEAAVIEVKTLFNYRDNNEDVSNLIELIKHSRDQLENRFWFGYVEKPNGVELTDIEQKIKEKLRKKFGIRTFAKSKKKSKTKIDIDFEIVKDRMIQCKDSTNITMAKVSNSQ
jgi:hypothetical protein